MNWKIITSDSGSLKALPRESIRGFLTGYNRTLRRTITGVPAGRAVTKVTFTIKRRRRPTAPEIIEKNVTVTVTPAQGQIIDDGSVSRRCVVDIALWGTETEKLFRRHEFDAYVTLDNGEVYPCAYGTIEGRRSLDGIAPSAPPSTAGQTPLRITATPDILSLVAIDSYVDVLVKVWNAPSGGSGIAGARVLVNNTTPAIVSANATELLTDSNGEAILRVTELAAGVPLIQLQCGEIVAILAGSGAPHHITADTASIDLAVGGAPLTVMASVEDVDNNVLVGEPITATVEESDGTPSTDALVSPASDETPGIFTVTPGGAAATAVLRLRAASGAILLELPITVAAGGAPPTQITTDAALDTLNLNFPGGTGTIVATLRDAGSNPVAGSITATIQSGGAFFSIAPLAPTASPESLTVTPLGVGSGVIRFTSGGITKDVTVNVTAGAVTLFDDQFTGGVADAAVTTAGWSNFPGAELRLTGTGYAYFKDNASGATAYGGYAIPSDNRDSAVICRWKFSGDPNYLLPTLIFRVNPADPANDALHLSGLAGTGGITTPAGSSLVGDLWDSGAFAFGDGVQVELEVSPDKTGYTFTHISADGATRTPMCQLTITSKNNAANIGFGWKTVAGSSGAGGTRMSGLQLVSVPTGTEQDSVDGLVTALGGDATAIVYDITPQDPTAAANGGYVIPGTYPGVSQWRDRHHATNALPLLQATGALQPGGTNGYTIAGSGTQFMATGANARFDTSGDFALFAVARIGDNHPLVGTQADVWIGGDAGTIKAKVGTLVLDSGVATSATTRRRILLVRSGATVTLKVGSVTVSGNLGGAAGAANGNLTFLGATPADGSFLTGGANAIAFVKAAPSNTVQSRLMAFGRQRGAAA